MINPAGERTDEEMTTKEVDRLIDWLISKGLTLDEARACIKYIAR